ncbi:MAG: hypothetical protein CMK33_05675 [Porticoccaceae bacterium]|nr:hypothetical protein [Porticoccaceae bacterium]
MENREKIPEAVSRSVKISHDDLGGYGMFRSGVACLLACCLLSGPALSAGESCRDEVIAAFSKQRSSGAYRMVGERMSETGPVEVTEEYIPPDRMRHVIVAVGQPPLQTVLVGRRAWSRQDGPWEELMPAIAQTIIAQVIAATAVPPTDVGQFECAGKATVDGKEYVAYRSVEKPGSSPLGPGGTPVHRTLYVDPATGLPAYNIVAEEKDGATPIFKGAYSYPDDLVIEGHPDAPLAKIR